MMNAQLLMNSTTVLPVKMGGRKYRTTDHYVFSSFLKGTARDLVLSYPVEKVRQAFHYHDEEQFRRVVYEACNRFHEKKCRSIEHQDGKTIGSLARGLLKEYPAFFYKTQSGPLSQVLGLSGEALCGYNLVGHSLLRMKFVVEKLPDLSGPMEYLFWRSHPEKENIKPIVPKTYRAILPDKKKKPQASTPQEEGGLVDYFYEAGNDDEYAVDDEPEEQGYNPEEVPVYSQDRVRWIATGANSRLDDLRAVGARADFLYTTDAPPTDPFQEAADPISRTDPLTVFKIYKAAEYLVGRMKDGMDIKAFLHKPVEAILWECGVAPELSNPKSLNAGQRHSIYVEHWQQFLSKTIPFYPLIEKELLYPQNLAGFIRQEYALDLNEWIGTKIREILFVSFAYQVIERSYPRVAPELRVVALTRERKQFSDKEYSDITDRLYHLFFQEKFQLDEEGTRRILMHESYRLSMEEIEQALLFVPCRAMATLALDIGGTILDPMAQVRTTIDDKVFHDLYQYVFYRLFIEYGALTQKDAYELLFHDGTMRKGDDARLAKTLQDVVAARKKKLALEAMTAQYAQHPQVREAVLYAKATKATPTAMAGVPTDPLDLQLMKWVVSTIPTTSKQHFEKSAHLYAFVHDLVRSLDRMKSIVGRRLQKKQLDVFFQCFYHNLKTIQQGLKVSKKPMPQAFEAYIHNTKTVHEDNTADLWQMVCPMVCLFQHPKFNPVAWLQEARETIPATDKQGMVRVLANVIQCLYPEQEVSNDQFYMITQMLSGRDDIAMWPDPSFTLIQEVEEDEGPAYQHLPEEIRRRMPKKKPGKKKMESTHYNIVHPLFATLQKEIQEAFHRPSPYDPVVSRASYALAALQKETLQPRRLAFYL